MSWREVGVLVLMVALISFVLNLFGFFEETASEPQQSPSALQTAVATAPTNTYSEVGWREVLGSKIDDVTGIPYYIVSLTEDQSKEMLVQVYASSLVESSGWYRRRNGRTKQIEIYVMTVQSPIQRIFVAKADAPRTRNDR